MTRTTPVANLFGDDETPAKKPRSPRKLDPYFDAIAELIGPASAKAQAGRVMRLAKKIAAANLAPSVLVARLPDVVRRYASWRKVIDLATVESCWPWIIDPPKTTGGDFIDQAAEALRRNGGKPPF